MNYPSRQQCRQSRRAVKKITRHLLLTVRIWVELECGHVDTFTMPSNKAKDYLDSKKHPRRECYRCAEILANQPQREANP